MIKVNVKMADFSKFWPNLKQAFEKTSKELFVFMDWVGQKVTPIRTWFLRKSFFYEIKENWGVFMNNAFYAWFVNFWTSKQTANPFMQKIVDEAENKLPDFLNNNLQAIWLYKK